MGGLCSRDGLERSVEWVDLAWDMDKMADPCESDEEPSGPIKCLWFLC